MRVCVVIPYDLAEEGGVKRNACHVAAALRARGDEVWVVGPSSSRSPESDHGPWTFGFRGVLNIPSNGSHNSYGIFIRPWAVRRFFAEHRFDAVHVHEPYAPLLPYAALWSSIDAAHVCTFHSYNHAEGGIGRVGRRSLGRLIFDHYERGIAVSESAAAFAGVAWRRPLAIIANGVPTETFRPPDDHRNRATVPTAERPLRLLFVGHWRDRRKGLQHLLVAFQRLRALGIPVELEVIGDGGGQPVPQINGVRFLGPIASEERLAEHYRASDIFVAPSTGQESFGIVLLEAMASARPIVCSEIDGYREVVTPDGARLCLAGEADAIATAVTDLASSPAERERMGAANRERALAYDWTAVAMRVRHEYVAAVAMKHRSRAGSSH